MANDEEDERRRDEQKDMRDRIQGRYAKCTEWEERDERILFQEKTFHRQRERKRRSNNWHQSKKEDSFKIQISFWERGRLKLALDSKVLKVIFQERGREREGEREMMVVQELYRSLNPPLRRIERRETQEVLMRERNRRVRRINERRK